jgi:LEA14-like dessication related protein
MLSLSGVARIRRVLSVAVLMPALLLAGCAGILERDAPQVSIVGLEPIAGEGLEMRMNVKLRVQNPSQSRIDYDGIALDLELNGRPFASGVSSETGSIPRFGETVLSVPVSVSAFSAIRQAWGYATGDALDDIPYVLRGKLAMGTFGTRRFTDRGTVDLPRMGTSN